MRSGRTPARCTCASSRNATGCARPASTSSSASTPPPTGSPEGALRRRESARAHAPAVRRRPLGVRGASGSLTPQPCYLRAVVPRNKSSTPTVTGAAEVPLVICWMSIAHAMLAHFFVRHRDGAQGWVADEPRTEFVEADDAQVVGHSDAERGVNALSNLSARKSSKHRTSSRLSWTSLRATPVKSLPVRPCRCAGDPCLPPRAP